jgi:hypothetical protein
MNLECNRELVDSIEFLLNVNRIRRAQSNKKTIQSVNQTCSSAIAALTIIDLKGHLIYLLPKIFSVRIKALLTVYA